MDPTIISLWPTVVAFASDIGLKDTSHARLMRLRGRIPERHRDRIIEAAKERGISIPPDLMSLSTAVLPDAAAPDNRNDPSSIQPETAA
jgi:hypothetical protein